MFDPISSTIPEKSHPETAPARLPYSADFPDETKKKFQNLIERKRIEKSLNTHSQQDSVLQRQP
jgi:hypothetical protein